VLLSERWVFDRRMVFVVREDEIVCLNLKQAAAAYPFRSGRESVGAPALSGRHHRPRMMMPTRSADASLRVEAHLDRVAAVMMVCIDRGMVIGGRTAGRFERSSPCSGDTPHASADDGAQTIVSFT